MAGLFVKLEVEWVDHEKLIEAGLDGAGLHATALCLAKRSNTDGWLTKALLVRYGATGELIDRLVALHLLESDGGRFRPSGWLDRNPSQGAIDATRAAKAEAAKAGNHKRWGHPGNVADCDTCNRSPLVDRISDRTGSHAVADPSPETETETETDPSSSQSVSTTPQPAGDERDQIYPRDVAAILGQRDHDAALATGKVQAVTAHGRQRHLEVCIDSALTEHGSRIVGLIAAHRDWTAERIAQAVSSPTTSTVPLEQSTNAAVLADQQRREREASYRTEGPAAPEVVANAAAAARAALQGRAS